MHGLRAPQEPAPGENARSSQKVSSCSAPVRGAVRLHLARALETLQGNKPLAAASVHRVRKELKRARAGLRLLRDAAGKPACARENARLRDAARSLAPLRDADVMVATLGKVLERKKARAHRAALARLRSRARREAAELRREAQGLEEIVNSLTETNDRVSKWRLPRDAWPVLRSGLERIYRRGREALAEARTRGTDRSLHEARKQVKYLGAALEILPRAAPRRNARLAKLSRRADAVAEALGYDHDLAMLRRRLGYAERDLRAMIDRWRGKLQKQAMKDARRLYRAKP